jgi:hypothetical protein
MSKGEKRCVLDATVGDLSRTVQSFRVSINSKGGDCWHVYRKNVLVIDGKNNNDDGMFTGKERNNDGKQGKHKFRRSEQYAETRKLRRDSSFQKRRRGPSHQDSQKDQRSRPLTHRHSSKSGGSVISGGGVTVVVGSVSRQEECAERSSRRSENMIDEQRLVWI